MSGQPVIEGLSPRAPAVPARGAPPRAGWLARYRWAVIAYLATRVAVMLTALVNGALGHHSVIHQLTHWDGEWYSLLALVGYPSADVPGTTTLGFFPLYSVLIRGLAYPLVWLTGQPIAAMIPIAGVIASTLGGLACAILVQRLARGWWDAASARRAVLFFCLFPGSVVFSMVYAEGLMLPLAAGCLLALERRRWVTAGLLAALVTATEPEGVVLVLACLVAVVVDLRRRGWSARPWAAPLLALAGVGSFAAYLWARTGTPLATLHAQASGWHETSDGLALVHMTRTLLGEISFTHFDHPTINLNLVVGLLGAIVLAALLVLVWRSRRQIPAPAIVWTLGIAYLTVTSEFVPPNPRLLITAFPAVLAVGHYVRGRWFAALAAVTGVLLVVMSALTFVGSTLRP